MEQMKQLQELFDLVAQIGTVDQKAFSEIKESLRISKGDMFTPLDKILLTKRVGKVKITLYFEQAPILFEISSNETPLPIREHLLPVNVTEEKREAFMDRLSQDLISFEKGDPLFMKHFEAVILFLKKEVIKNFSKSIINSKKREIELFEKLMMEE